MEKKEPQEKNHIRVGFSTRVGNIIRYVNMLLKEGSYSEVKFSAIGGAIGSLVNAVEVIKTVNEGFYQVNTISTVSHQTVDSHKNVLNTRLSPKMEILLTKVEPKEKGEGFQDKLSEDERKKLENFLNTNFSRRRQDSSSRRGPRSRGFRENRGGRGGFRRMERGARDGRRGGERTFRGTNRKTRDDGFRDDFRGGFRDDFRGGFRGGFRRGGNRGFRGRFSGGSRGGRFRGSSRGRRFRN